MTDDLVRRAIAEWPDDILAWPHDLPIADAFRAAAERGCPLSRALANLDQALDIAASLPASPAPADPPTVGAGTWDMNAADDVPAYAQSPTLRRIAWQNAREDRG